MAVLGLAGGRSVARAQEAQGGTPLLLAGGSHHARHSYRHRRTRHAAAAEPRSEPAAEAPVRHAYHSRHYRGRHYARHGHGRAVPDSAAETQDASPPAPAPSRQAAVQHGPATVSILTGALGSTSSRMAADLSAVLDSETMRIEPVIGKGPLADPADLADMQNVDLALVRSDAPAPRPRAGFAPTYLVRLYNQEVHILAGPGVTDIRQLDGKRVAVGEPASSSEATAEAIFDRLGIHPVPVELDQPAALRELHAGTVAAAVFVSGKPAPDLAQIPDGSGLHLLSVPYSGPLQDRYFPARLSHADYPALVPAGAGIDTVAVGTMLVANDAPRGSARYERLAAFSKAFLDHFTALKADTRHPKWREINLAAQVPGWTRFVPARQALDDMPTTAAAGPAPPAPSAAIAQADAGASADKTSFDRFVASRTGGSDPAHLSSAEQDRLLKEYEQWKQKPTR